MNNAVTLRIEQRWDHVEERARALNPSPGLTIRPTLPLSTGTLRALGLMPDGPALTLGRTIGEGGMGELRLGTQGSLDREVAVKSVRVDRESPQAIGRLLEEAWILGRLEHPNIVPVYDLGRAENGTPLIVMKRIEGVPWSQLVHDGDNVRSRFGAEDLLDWNLRVLLSVCNAVEFAHSRSILHLDLKPDNVMLGRFGEVYVLDWGIAVSTDPAEQRVTRAHDVKEIVGTPAYMAPELLSADGALLGVWTDVALLGAVLYEILAGRPPWGGPHALAVFYQVVHGEPERPRDVPGELWSLCTRALAKEPAGRPASVLELRLGLQRFLEHRDSVRLAEEAHARLDGMVALLAVAADNPQVSAHASAARFGFSQALLSWPGNVAAQDGLRQVIRLQASRAIVQGELRSARSLCQELTPPDPELEALLVTAQQKADEERARFAALDAKEARQDRRVGQRTRWFVLTVLSILWILTPLASLIGDGPAWPGTWDRLFLVPTVSLAVATGLFIWARDSLGRTDLNKRTVWTVVVNLLGQLLLTWVGYRSGLTPLQFVPFMTTLWATVVMMYMVAVDRRTWGLVAVYPTATVVSSVFPPWSFLAVELANVGLLLTVSFLWWPGRLRPTPEERALLHAGKPLPLPPRERGDREGPAPGTR